MRELGGKGLILREPGSKYETRRSKTLRKVKTFTDDEALVVALEDGKGGVWVPFFASTATLFNSRYALLHIPIDSLNVYCQHLCRTLWVNSWGEVKLFGFWRNAFSFSCYRLLLVGMILCMGESSAASFAANVLLLIEAAWFLNFVLPVSVRCFHSSFLSFSLALRTFCDRYTEEKSDSKLAHYWRGLLGHWFLL